jgi:hypothetical protein
LDWGNDRAEACGAAHDVPASRDVSLRTADLAPAVELASRHSDYNPRPVERRATID